MSESKVGRFVEFKNAIYPFSDEDIDYLKNKVRPAIERMTTHLEIFELPSGKELWAYADGRCFVRQGCKARDV